MVSTRRHPRANTQQRNRLALAEVSPATRNAAASDIKTHKRSSGLPSPLPAIKSRRLALHSSKDSSSSSMMTSPTQDSLVQQKSSGARPARSRKPTLKAALLGPDPSKLKKPRARKQSSRADSFSQQQRSSFSGQDDDAQDGKEDMPSFGDLPRCSSPIFSSSHPGGSGTTISAVDPSRRLLSTSDAPSTLLATPTRNSSIDSLAALEADYIDPPASSRRSSSQRPTGHCPDPSSSTPITSPLHQADAKDHLTRHHGASLLDDGMLSNNEDDDNDISALKTGAATLPSQEELETLRQKRELQDSKLEQLESYLRSSSYIPQRSARPASAASRSATAPRASHRQEVNPAQAVRISDGEEEDDEFGFFKAMRQSKGKAPTRDHRPRLAGPDSSADLTAPGVIDATQGPSSKIVSSRLFPESQRQPVQTPATATFSDLFGDTDSSQHATTGQEAEHGSSKIESDTDDSSVDPSSKKMKQAKQAAWKVDDLVRAVLPKQLGRQANKRKKTVRASSSAASDDVFSSEEEEEERRTQRRHAQPKSKGAEERSRSTQKRKSTAQKSTPSESAKKSASTTTTTSTRRKRSTAGKTPTTSPPKKRQSPDSDEESDLTDLDALDSGEEAPQTKKKHSDLDDYVLNEELVL